MESCSRNPNHNETNDACVPAARTSGISGNRRSVASAPSAPHSPMGKPA
jgi:hypothetical protein